MAFVADRATSRVVDEERGLELVEVSGGSDGRLGFKLVGDGFECSFDACRRIRTATPVERQARPDVAHTAIWELSNVGSLIPGMTKLQTCQLLAEALLAARFSHRHDEVNWTVLFPHGAYDERAGRGL